MPISYEIDRESGLARVTALGEVSFEEEKQCFDEILADPSRCPGCGILLDNRERGTPATAEHVKGMAHAFQERQTDVGYAKLAIVVSKEVSFGLGRMFSTLVDELPIETGVFRDIDEAEEWLAGAGGDDD
jgi:hypothetical protein